MNGLARAAVEDALEAGYPNVTAVADGLDEADLMLPSRCAGWAVGDRRGRGRGPSGLCHGRDECDNTAN